MAEQKIRLKDDGRKRPPRKKKDEGGEVKGSIKFSQAFSAKVEEVIGRTGARGEITQVKCKIIQGKSEGRVMRRNVKGSVKVGDLLTLRETEIEARRIHTARRRSV